MLVQTKLKQKPDDLLKSTQDDEWYLHLFSMVFVVKLREEYLLLHAQFNKLLINPQVRNALRI